MLSQKVLRKRRVATSALILSGNVCIGNQIASLLHNVGWQTHVIHHYSHVYNLLNNEQIDSVIVDIDSPGLNGLPCMFWCKVNRPMLAIYAICSGGNSKAMQTARNIGCKGYFYIRQGKILVDTRCGLARGLTRNS